MSLYNCARLPSPTPILHPLHSPPLLRGTLLCAHVRGVCSQACSGNVCYPYWSHDIGGHFPGPVEDELYVRWIQWAAFNPVSAYACPHTHFTVHGYTRTIHTLHANTSLGHTRTTHTRNSKHLCWPRNVTAPSSCHTHAHACCLSPLPSLSHQRNSLCAIAPPGANLAASPSGRAKYFLYRLPLVSSFACTPLGPRRASVVSGPCPSGTSSPRALPSSYVTPCSPTSTRQPGRRTTRAFH